MIRVLHIMGCADAGGISAVVLNYYRFIDRTKIHFDIALTVPEAGQNAYAIQALGAEIHFLPLKSNGLKAFQDALAELLQKGQYDAVHVHESETCYVAMAVAKKLGLRCRVAHAHTCSPWEGWKGELRRISGVLMNYPVATHVIGCGRKAGDRIFGKWNMRRPKAVVLPNAVDTRKFAFDEALRREVRNELGIEGKFVLGMVGRLCVEKNYPFALELVAALCKEDLDTVLVIVGNGEEEAVIREKIVDLGISDHVKLLGRRADVHRMYQGFDLFLLPSFTEGFPVAAVEALSSGLPILLSDRITEELKIFTNAEYLSLDNVQGWLSAIRSRKTVCDRTAYQKEVLEYGFDILDCARVLSEIYEKDVG